ncbi:MAG: bifunctional phosphoribosylaminoimidazolecarboxamide formyltransferase/IMP cyclohydrolase [Thermoanaerobaculia bacterium]|nr:bifunctional phosphoribosylaminoimidazolecarboxamide formyltransferase/IMP cyclohydrolase [Thermoanaerobaculia bacterium]
MLRARRALVSVSDKTGVAPFAKGLSELGVEILSTGGTLRHLSDAGVPVTAVADVTGSPEILDGRVKTLHPRIHGGILADRSKEEHLQELDDQGIVPIDVVAVNLYPFQQTVAQEGVSAADAIEMIDIGGPCMTRAAAKNYRGVVVVVDPGDYEAVLAALREGDGTVPEELREKLALKAFRHTQEYDTAIAGWLGSRNGSGPAAGTGESSPASLPDRLTIELEKAFEPRYGENPHQASAIYRTVGEGGILGGFEKLQGKELSWNNMLDADAARKLVSLFEEPAVVIVKHNNPCGVGRGATLAEAYARALECDPVSAFGSIIATNREADGDLAEAMRELFVEVVIAPSYAEGARDIYGRKKNLRVLVAPLYATDAGAIELRGIDGGFLAQTPDGLPEDPEGWKCVTERRPTAEEMRALDFAWKLTRYTKSNAIVLTNADQSVGIGAGQMSRVDSCRIAIDKAQLPVTGTVAGSDAFFPFRDALDVLADAGVVAIAQPGGSMRDDEVIAAADERGLSMVLTGRRHFRH